MSTAVESQRKTGTWTPPETRPLNEGAWQAWAARGRAHDRKGNAERLVAVKCLSVATLLAAAGLWSNESPYDLIVRFVVAVGASVVMFKSIQAGHYTVAAVFAALVLLYNPVVPVFSFSGGWQHALLVISAVPFVASLTWRNVKLAHVT
jgi:hypothetical protein